MQYPSSYSNALVAVAAHARPSVIFSRPGESSKKRRASNLRVCAYITYIAGPSELAAIAVSVFITPFLTREKLLTGTPTAA